MSVHCVALRSVLTCMLPLGSFLYPTSLSVLLMRYDAILSAPSLLRSLLSLGIHFRVQSFIHLAQSVLRPKSLLSYRVWEKLTVTMRFFLLQRCRLSHRFQQNTVLSHMQLAPITHGLLTHRGARVWQFKSICYSCSGKLRLSS